MWTTRTTIVMLMSGVATIASLGQASALEAQAFVDRLTAVYKSAGLDFEFGSATMDGDTIIVDGVTISPEMHGGQDPMHFDTEITFSGVTEGDDGSYYADSATIPDIETEFAADPKGEFSLKDIRIEDLYVPGEDPVPAIANMQLMGAMSTGALSVRRAGEEVIAFESFVNNYSYNPAQGSADLVDMQSSVLISGIEADLSSVSEEDPGAGAIIDALGLSQISGDISQESSWSMADGHLTIDEFLFDFADVGALDIQAEVTGLTPAVIEQIVAMQANMEAGGEMTDEKAQAQMMQGMAIMQGVSIVGASVRYDDASLASSLIDFFAAQSGADRDTFVAGLKSMLPMMIGETGIPALKDIVVPPVESFLDNPESLEVRIAPPSPTSALVLMAAAANPAGLIKALGLVVEANMPLE
ncbi:hypothetical protein KD146_13675 [Devosia sp. BSSL-BM10]|uniref:Uncharacterized protein n=1 Tax=Devosia litorisediminis TaxID=2829817 RepID=A0A942EC85_9HYPH|nr:hypothetical protein [Devosia litorisediminis]MBS3849749.1 hypothetical protein [Devosia litorisediminis]